MKDKRDTEGLRRQHNADLIRRMRNGEPLTAIDSKASWYPPRPVIKKDPNEMARLYAGQSKKPTGDGSGPLGEAS